MHRSLDLLCRKGWFFEPYIYFWCLYSYASDFILCRVLCLSAKLKCLYWFKNPTCFLLIFKSSYYDLTWMKFFRVALAYFLKLEKVGRSLCLIDLVHIMILFSGVAGLNLGKWVDCRHDWDILRAESSSPNHSEIRQKSIHRLWIYALFDDWFCKFWREAQGHRHWVSRQWCSTLRVSWWAFLHFGGLSLLFSF